MSDKSYASRGHSGSPRGSDSVRLEGRNRRERPYSTNQPAKRKIDRVLAKYFSAGSVSGRLLEGIQTQPKRDRATLRGGGGSDPTKSRDAECVRGWGRSRLRRVWAASLRSLSSGPSVVVSCVWLHADVKRRVKDPVKRRSEDRFTPRLLALPVGARAVCCETNELGIAGTRPPLLLISHGKEKSTGY